MKAKVLSSLTPQELIGVIKEILNILSSDSWTDVDDWFKKELDLMGMSETVAGNKLEALGKFGMGLSIKQFLNSIIESLEINELQDEAAKPELLQKVRDVFGAKVHGPCKISSLGPETFEVWTRPTDISDVCENNSNKGTALVLGAGNNSFLTLVDALHQIFIEQNTVLIKHHPLRPYLMEPYEVILKPLIQRGYLYQVLDYGIPFTQKILASPLVNHVHITGSLQTSKAVQKFLATSRPEMTEKEIDSMVTSELGCATPFVITPETYSNEELQNIATLLVGSKKNNAGHNCLATQVLVLPKEWEQKDLFQKILMKEFKNQPTQPMYYPGSAERRKFMMEQYKSRVKSIKSTSLVEMECEECDEMTILYCGDPKEDDYIDKAIKSEAFGSVLAIVELSFPSELKSKYLNEIAVPFLNDKSNIFGSLSCSLIIPNSQIHDEVTQKAIGSLRYGAVVVNEASFFGYSAMTRGAVWGANPLDSTGQSGNGYIGNHFKIPSVEKTVVYGNSLKVKSQVTMELPPALLFDVIRIALLNQGIIDATWRTTKLFVSKIFSPFVSKYISRAS